MQTLPLFQAELGGAAQSAPQVAPDAAPGPARDDAAAPTAIEPPEESPPRPVWARRWAMIRAVLGFCAGIVVYATVFGPDDRVRETALLGALGLAGAVALGYLGFATQDDRNWLAAVAGGRRS